MKRLQREVTALERDPGFPIEGVQLYDNQFNAHDLGILERAYIENTEFEIVVAGVPTAVAVHRTDKRGSRTLYTLTRMLPFQP